jgi:BirA family biotin operon repressor/biotin-[acetyl-CoA-carboxylase] ligase
VIERVSSTGSTNADVRAWARAGRPHGDALIADVQTAGRGRLGREWASVAGNLHLSILLRPALGLDRAALVCLAAAVAVAEAAGPTWRIKWPNDVVDGEGRKLAGILAEVEPEPTFALVVGVGVNVAHAPLATATRVDADRLVLAECIVAGVLDRTALLVAAPSRLLDAWRARASTLGKRVRIGAIEGVAVDVDLDGALRVRTDDGAVVRITAGDVTLVG